MSATGPDRLTGWTRETVDGIEIDLTPVMAPVPSEVRLGIEVFSVVAGLLPLPLVPLGLGLLTIVLSEGSATGGIGEFLLFSAALVLGPLAFLAVMVATAAVARGYVQVGPRSTKLSIDATGLTVVQDQWRSSTRERIPLGTIVRVVASVGRLVVETTDGTREIPVVGRSRATLEEVATMVEGHLARFTQKESRADVPRALSRLVHEG